MQMVNVYSNATTWLLRPSNDENFVDWTAEELTTLIVPALESVRARKLIPAEKVYALMEEKISNEI